MIKRQAYKFQLRPDRAQASAMVFFSGACRFVYNRALIRQSENWKRGEKFTAYNSMASWLVEWKGKEDTGWLKLAPSQTLQQSLKDLDKAFSNLFAGRARHPSLKKKGRNESFRYPLQRVRLDEQNSRIFLPKLGWVRYRKSRNITGQLKNVTVSMKLGKWYISLQTETVMEEVLYPPASMTGLNISNSDHVFSSEGDVFDIESTILKERTRLEKNLRQLRRKKRFSANWCKQKFRVNKNLNRISNITKNHFHRISTAISKNHASVVIEEPVQMSEAGTQDAAASFTDAYELKRQLNYKLGWRGGTLIKVPGCNQPDVKARMSADAGQGIVKAQQILAAGHAVMACGG